MIAALRGALPMFGDFTLARHHEGGPRRRRVAARPSSYVNKDGLEAMKDLILRKQCVNFSAVYIGCDRTCA
ncbi:hypothetical protein [Massilia glaciei]|uniref:hypothetical protein n=1 Tax=Massilia glaciei TaxID=1524097 RepID=UPI0015E807A3|nr:hypothetical protein [Massilia glaciei]